jgi:hypothetical protein
MLRRTQRRSVGYTPVNPDTSPMVSYNNYHWNYTKPQGMEAPLTVNRTMSAPYTSAHRNVNLYRGVWIELDMHPVYRVALEPYLKKLPLTRKIPNTSCDEAASDFRAVSPKVNNAAAEDAWLAKVFQLCGFQRKGEVALSLWNDFCKERFTKNGEKPPVALIKAILFCLTKSGSAEWQAIFDQCLKHGWNITPLFDTSLWACLLECAGRLDDGKAVRKILDEMIDVQACIDSVDSTSLVVAVNAITDPDDYNFLKKFLFNLGGAKTLSLAKRYTSLRGKDAASLKVPLKENDNVYYHVCWHSSVRQPQKFSPRQLFFNYKPSAETVSTTPNSKMEDIVKEKIENWKAEGLLPQDYVHEDSWYDKAQAFKLVAKQERWMGLPEESKKDREGILAVQQSS